MKLEEVMLICCAKERPQISLEEAAAKAELSGELEDFADVLQLLALKALDEGYVMSELLEEVEARKDA